MSQMITIKGKEVSEDTIVEALKKHCNFDDKPYIFQPGDVAKEEGGNLRIITKRYDGGVQSTDINGGMQSGSQRGFECFGYKKIGRLKDMLAWSSVT